MTLDPNQLFASSSGVGSSLRCFPTSIQPKTFAAGTGILKPLTALSFNTSTKFFQVFGGTTNEVNTLTANAVPATAGTFTITVNGQTTAGIAFNATAAAVQSALEALSNVEVGDVVAVQTAGANLGAALAVVTLTWGGLLAGQDIAISIATGGLTGNPPVLATTVAGGVAQGQGTDTIRGFVWPDPVVLAPANEVIGNVVMGGRIHFDDIPLVSGSYGILELRAALRTGLVRELGYIIEGLSQFN